MMSLFIYFLADLPQKHRPGLAGQISLVKSKNMWYVTVAVKSNDIVSFSALYTSSVFSFLLRVDFLQLLLCTL